MYRKHFALIRHPFDKDLKPDELFASTAAAELEARLHYLVKLQGIGLFTGEVGSGKTCIARKVASSLHSGLYRTFYVTLATGTVMDLYKTIAWEMKLDSERSLAALFRAIRDEVTRLSLAAKIRPILIIDEAQHLRNEVLENLRLLTNYEMDSQNRLTMILIGQAELRRRLAMAVHEPLAQRLVVRYHLAGLLRDELPDYLAHRFRLAGSELQLFEHQAIEAIFQATNGLPRKVNLLAMFSLNVAALKQTQMVSVEDVKTAVDELS